jgi:glycosyltransferase involved in cell wall biosynthesis
VKLVQVSTRYPPAPGGVERHVREVSSRLVQRGHTVTAVATDLYREIPWQRLPAEVPRSETVDGVQIRRLRAFTLPGELHYPFFRRLGPTLRELAPELVHVHTYGTHHASVVHRFSRSHHVPWVITAHFHPIWSIWGGSVRHSLRRFYDREVGGRVIQNAARVIVQSREEERLMRAAGLALPPTVKIPPGYTPLPPPLAGERPFARRFKVEGPFALFVGRLASNKGLEELVQAFASMRQRVPDAELVLIGEDGGMRPTLERLVQELGVSRQVHFTGYIADEQMLASGFAEARVFVLASEYEAFGLVLLEAMAQGTPVIASRVGGIPEFVEDGKAGRLIPPKNPSAIEAALEEVWEDDSLRSRWGTYGRDQIVPQYSWDRVVDQLEALYREVRGP